MSSYCSKRDYSSNGSSYTPELASHSQTNGRLSVALLAHGFGLTVKRAATKVPTREIIINLWRILYKVGRTSPHRCNLACTRAPFSLDAKVTVCNRVEGTEAATRNDVLFSGWQINCLLTCLLTYGTNVKLTSQGRSQNFISKAFYRAIFSPSFFSTFSIHSSAFFRSFFFSFPVK